MTEYTVIHNAGRSDDVDVAHVYATATEALEAAERLPAYCHVRLHWEGETYPLDRARVRLSTATPDGT